MEKLNIAELLKDCPQGMELYSPIFGKVYLDKIRPHLAIVVTTDKKQGDFKEEFLYDGRYGMNGECMLFPSKGNRNWSKFHRPFKDGDIIYVCDEYSDATFTYVAILNQIEKEGKIQSHCFYNFEDDYFSIHDFLYDDYNIRFATEEEKEKLFKVIKDNGYKWNTETKTLEKLIEPKFKVRDKIKHKTDKWLANRTIKSYDKTIGYYTTINDWVRIEDQDNWELVPNKFDITTLKPFDKVLVRDTHKEKWNIHYFSYIDSVGMFKTIMGTYSQCIPYEGNKHLLGTSNDCDDFYKTWK